MGLITSKAPLRETHQVKGFKNSSSAERKSPCETSKTPSPAKEHDSKVNDYYEERTPVHHKVLKSLKSLDPRSPTVGINRTPILVEDTASCDTKLNNFDSPVSIYSSNVSNSSTQDVPTPIEPPVNVSGFDETNEDESGLYVVSELLGMTKMMSDMSETLRVRDKPTTYEAKKLLKEIILADENTFNKSCTPVRKHVKVTPKTKSVKRSDGLKVNFLKTRTPLSNITSSANSPSSLVQCGRVFSRSKACTEFGAENATSPLGSQLAQWDKNKTVII